MDPGLSTTQLLSKFPSDERSRVANLVRRMIRGLQLETIRFGRDAHLVGFPHRADDTAVLLAAVHREAGRDILDLLARGVILPQADIERHIAGESHPSVRKRIEEFEKRGILTRTDCLEKEQRRDARRDKCIEMVPHWRELWRQHPEIRKLVGTN